MAVADYGALVAQAGGGNCKAFYFNIDLYSPSWPVAVGPFSLLVGQGDLVRGPS